MSRIQWWQPEIGAEEPRLVAEVLASNYVNEGEVTEEFERQLAALMGVPYAVATTSGTIAISLALAGLGVGPGDEVIVPDITFIATANAVRLVGARPILVDVDPATLNLAPEAFERAISPRTKAVVPVHVSGRGADMPALLEIAGRKGIFVVEDAAEALLSKRNGRFLGTFGHAGCFSFSPNKTITTGQGGLVVTEDQTLYGRMRELKDQGRPVRGTGGDDIHHSVGYNFKFTNLQAAVGLGQLRLLDARHQRQRQIHLEYRAGLDGMAAVHLFPADIAGGEIPQWTDALVDRRGELDAYLRSQDIHVRRFWLPLHTQAPYRLADDAFPNSTALCPRALWLPSAFTLTPRDIDTVCQHIRRFYGTTS